MTILKPKGIFAITNASKTPPLHTRPERSRSETEVPHKQRVRFVFATTQLWMCWDPKPWDPQLALIQAVMGEGSLPSARGNDVEYCIVILLWN